MGSGNEDEYAVFEQKVKRTVFMDNLSPSVTEAVLRNALDQYGTVKSVEFVTNYLEPKSMPLCALVEMEKEKQAEVVISTLSQFPFMMSGMPRPVRARAAVAEMFSDRPRKPGRQIHFRWLDPGNPDFEVASKLKQLVKKHDAEHTELLKLQLEKEEKLAKQQGDYLKANYKKYEMIDALMGDGTARHLARRYNLRVADDSGPSTFH